MGTKENSPDSSLAPYTHPGKQELAKGPVHWAVTWQQKTLIGKRQELWEQEEVECDCRQERAGAEL